MAVEYLQVLHILYLLKAAESLCSSQHSPNNSVLELRYFLSTCPQ